MLNWFRKKKIDNDTMVKEGLKLLDRCDILLRNGTVAQIQEHVIQVRKIDKQVKSSDLDRDFARTVRTALCKKTREVAVSLQNDRRQPYQAMAIIKELLTEFGDIPQLRMLLEQDVEQLNLQIQYIQMQTEKQKTGQRRQQFEAGAHGNNGVRYNLEFRILPAYVQRDPGAFLEQCLKNPPKYFFELFHTYYKTIPDQASILPELKAFTRKDFSSEEWIYSDGTHILYIQLPQIRGGAHVYCTAYAFAFDSIRSRDSIRFFTVEESVFGTSCIGTMTDQGGHLNLGDGGADQDENIRELYRITTDRAEGIVPTKVSWYANDEGWYSAISNEETGGVEFTSYDMYGQVTERNYAVFR